MEELSQLILCSNQMELNEALQFNINSINDRKRLLIHLHKKIKPPNYIVPNRLEVVSLDTATDNSGGQVSDNQLETLPSEQHPRVSFSAGGKKQLNPGLLSSRA